MAVSDKTARGPAKRFEDVVAWQKSHALVLEIYRVSAGFPKNETFGLTSQLRRSAVSVPANIAEGFKRQGKAEKARFLNIAEASLEEARYYLILARDLGYLRDGTTLQRLQEAAVVLGAYRDGLLKSL